MKKLFKWLLIIVAILGLAILGIRFYFSYTWEKEHEAYVDKHKVKWVAPYEIKDAITDEASFTTFGFSKEHGSLDFTCENKELGLAISLNSFHSTRDNLKVIYRIDENPAVETTATPAISGQAFWPKNPETIIESILSGEKVTIRAFKYDGSSHDGSFDISPEGKQNILQVKEYCSKLKKG